MKLSDQAVGALMMALQKSLLEQTDIVPVLKDFKLEVDDSGEVVVMNPPIVKSAKTIVSTEDDTEDLPIGTTFHHRV
jgi:hypothetical protein